MSLQRFLRKMEKEFGITEGFKEASDHPYHCKCDKCKDWWISMGPEENMDGSFSYGPFSKEEIDARRKSSV